MGSEKVWCGAERHTQNFGTKISIFFIIIARKLMKYWRITWKASSKEKMIADLVICQIYKEVTNGENKPLTKDNGFIGLNRGRGSNSRMGNMCERPQQSWRTLDSHYNRQTRNEYVCRQKDPKGLQRFNVIMKGKEKTKSFANMFKTQCAHASPAIWKWKVAVCDQAWQ